MSRFVFVIALIYFLVDGLRAWASMFAGDYVAVNSFSNTAMLAGVVMVISLVVMLNQKNK